jgi:hypothetical protein
LKDKVKDVPVRSGHFEETWILSKERLNSIPKYAVYREEFIKCGKDVCNLCPHGSYYQAYWKDKTNN